MARPWTWCTGKRELFPPSSLGLSYRVLTCGEEARPAREEDVEAWLPGRGMWGEASSCSNCGEPDQEAQGSGMTRGGWVQNGTAGRAQDDHRHIVSRAAWRTGECDHPEVLRPIEEQGGDRAQAQETETQLHTHTSAKHLEEQTL